MLKNVDFACHSENIHVILRYYKKVYLYNPRRGFR